MLTWHLQHSGLSPQSHSAALPVTPCPASSESPGTPSPLRLRQRPACGSACPLLPRPPHPHTLLLESFRVFAYPSCDSPVHLLLLELPRYYLSHLLSFLSHTTYPPLRKPAYPPLCCPAPAFLPRKLLVWLCPPPTTTHCFSHLPESRSAQSPDSVPLSWPLWLLTPWTSPSSKSSVSAAQAPRCPTLSCPPLSHL